MSGLNADCHYGDHSYRDGSVCVACGHHLRCYCGRFIREDEIEAHIEMCPSLLRLAETEQFEGDR
jgi:hypothetical protein